MRASARKEIGAFGSNCLMQDGVLGGSAAKLLWRNKMQQDRNLYNEETHRMADHGPEHDDNQTGSEIPSGDGTVGQEQVNAIDDRDTGKSTGQDHSTEDHSETMPEEGVGAFQDSSDTTSDIAHIDEEGERSN